VRENAEAHSNDQPLKRQRKSKNKQVRACVLVCLAPSLYILSHPNVTSNETGDKGRGGRCSRHRYPRRWGSLERWGGCKVPQREKGSLLFSSLPPLIHQTDYDETLADERTRTQVDVCVCVFVCTHPSSSCYCIQAFYSNMSYDGTHTEVRPRYKKRALQGG